MVSAALVKRFYPDESQDGAVAFYGWVRQFTNQQTVMLNLGAGPPADRARIRVFRGEVAKVVGADIDPEVIENKELDEAHVYQPGETLPFAPDSFDLVLSDWVVEHVTEPPKFLAEVRRILKPGRPFFFRTPNRWHYVPIIARCTPHWFHELVANWARGYPPGTHEPWPTVYRLNRKSVIERDAHKAGFSAVEVKLWEDDPGYLRFHPLAFVLGVGYERIVNRYGFLAPLRACIFAKLVK